MIKTGLKQSAETDILTNSGKKVDEEHVISKSQSSRSCRREREYKHCKWKQVVLQNSTKRHCTWKY